MYMTEEHCAVHLKTKSVHYIAQSLHLLHICDHVFVTKPEFMSVRVYSKLCEHAGHRPDATHNGSPKLLLSPKSLDLSILSTKCLVEIQKKHEINKWTQSLTNDTHVLYDWVAEHDYIYCYFYLNSNWFVLAVKSIDHYNIWIDKWNQLSVFGFGLTGRTTSVIDTVQRTRI